MLDSKLLRNDLQGVAALLGRRGFELDVSKLESLEEKRKTLQVNTQSLQNDRNTRSKSIGKAKAAGEDIQPLLDEVMAGLNATEIADLAAIPEPTVIGLMSLCGLALVLRRRK